MDIRRATIALIAVLVVDLILLAVAIRRRRVPPELRKEILLPRRVGTVLLMVAAMGSTVLGLFVASRPVIPDLLRFEGRTYFFTSGSSCPTGADISEGIGASAGYVGAVHPADDGASMEATVVGGGWLHGDEVLRPASPQRTGVRSVWIRTGPDCFVEGQTPL